MEGARGRGEGVAGGVKKGDKRRGRREGYKVD
jgi:hypothetical protein